ncbi:hypothetical protein HDU93_008196 [Gonapodya sp. JEL0774]|nr:hypothetical protein HDU93_008196 [Gonapodya sp. JEL0774]
MIKHVFIFNNHGKPRLVANYEYLDVNATQALLRQIFTLVSDRPDSACNFVETSGIKELQGQDLKVIYRHYATLYFVFLADSSESQLGVLDLIQVLVESLDRVFENVCELDVVFRPDEVRHVLNEIVAGGMVLETNLTEVVGVVKEMNKKAGVMGRSSDARW